MASTNTSFQSPFLHRIRSKVFEICDEIEGRGLKDLFIHCSNGIRADRVDREMLTRMWEVGFRYRLAVSKWPKREAATNTINPTNFCFSCS